MIFADRREHADVGGAGRTETPQLALLNIMATSVTLQLGSGTVFTVYRTLTTREMYRRCSAYKESGTTIDQARWWNERGFDKHCLE